MPNESYDAIRTRVLTDNTAQGVLNHLSTLESNRAHVLTRWVWELLQNARDASVDSGAGLVASIEQNQAEIIFRHNGSDFKIDEIAHLIYHGSTKIEDTGTIGQYGSGFLTTHLLSPEINVSGQIDDGRRFEFQLKREVGSVSDLSESMEKAWNDFQHSLSDASDASDFSTQFRYPLKDNAFDAVSKGIETLKRCAPFVVVFNQEFSEIDIKSLDGTIGFKVVERKPTEQEGLQLVTVAESENGNYTESQYLLAQGHTASVATSLEPGDKVRCLPISEVPRLFLGFPLVGTENFSFPAVINSMEFTPTENRDGVFLWQNEDETNLRNQAVIEEACELLIHLLQFSASSSWSNSYVLANIPTVQERSWLTHPDLLRRCLAEHLVQKIKQTPVVINEAGEAISPNSLELPMASTDDAIAELWDLLDGWQGARQTLPRRDEAAGWCEAARSWANILGNDVLDFDEVTDGRKLASRVETDTKNVPGNCGRLENLQGFLRQDIPAVEWLNDLYTFLKKNGLDDVIRTCEFILDQDGWLDKLSNLHRDKNIDNELKEITFSLDWNIKQELRDTRLTSLEDELGAGDRDDNYVVENLLKKLQERTDNNPDDKFGQASVRLFAWIVSQENWRLLSGFPVFSERGESDNWNIFKLERIEANTDGPLAPIMAWPEDLQPFSEIFPRRHTLSNDFFKAVSNPEVWQTLGKENFLRQDVIITKEVRFDTFLPDEPLTEADHKTAESVTVTDLAFISRDDIGIMARVRQSQRLALLFWRFLTEWMIVQDSKGLEINESLCDCGESHRYYPAEWLVPLKRNRWVPLGGDKRGQATAQSLADLLRNSGWETGSLNENPLAVKLLEAINITRFDLVRAFSAVSDEERKRQDGILTGIMDAAAGDISHLNHAIEYIEALKNDEDLPNVLAERQEQRRRINENQNLGKQVEDLVKANLEGAGFTVRRKPIGSDFEIEHDLVEQEEEVGIEVTQENRTWLVEVKATRDQRVRMTERQAQTAKQEGDRFLLCVVPIDSGISNPELDVVRTNMRFVENIAPLVTRLCDDLDGFKELQEDITADEHSGVQLEVETGVIRVRVASSVWEDNGFSIEDLLNRLLMS